MIKKTLTAAIILFSCISIQAQSLKIGAKGGATVNKLNGSAFKDKFTFGYHIGGFAEIGLSKKISIQPEVLFNQINIDTATSFSSLYKFDSLSKIQLKYLSIPLVLNYKVNKLLSLQAGPQFGILMNSSNSLLQNGKNAFKSGDFSMIGGAQLNFTGIRIYGRYVIGLNNINDLDNKSQWKSQSVQLGLGLTL